VDRIPFCYSSTFVVNNRTTGAEQDHRSGTGADYGYKKWVGRWVTGSVYTKKMGDYAASLYAESER